MSIRNDVADAFNSGNYGRAIRLCKGVLRSDNRNERNFSALVCAMAHYKMGARETALGVLYDIINELVVFVGDNDDDKPSESEPAYLAALRFEVLLTTELGSPQRKARLGAGSALYRVLYDDGWLNDTDFCAFANIMDLDYLKVVVL